MHSMKKVLSVLLAIIIVFSFCSCANSSSDNDSSGSGSSNNSLFSKKDTEPLNAQNFVSRLKDSDGFLYSFSGDSAKVLYFLEDDSIFKYAEIEDYETLSFDYQELSNSFFECNIEIYNDSHCSITWDIWEGSFSCTLAYAGPENRFIIFTRDKRYKEGDVDFTIYDIFPKADIFMSKEDMKSFLKSFSALVEKYSEEELEVLYPSTLEGQIKLITDCIESAN